jgi:ligand-binding sensor domain-containing protein
MRFILVLILAFPFFVVDITHAQELGTWESYSSLRPVRFIDEDAEGSKWIATEGGLYSIVNGQTDAIFTRTEGLYRLNPSAMAYHAATGMIWIGYDDGMLESFDTKTELFNRDDAIFRATQFTRRAINSIQVGTDRIYIATSFGVVVYDPARRIVLDTYANLGSFRSGTGVNDLALAGTTIYAATDEGLAIGNPAQGDLVNPASWSNTTHRDFMQSKVVRSVAWFRDRLYASIGQSNFIFQNGNWQSINDYPSGPITRFRLSKSKTRLIAVADGYARIVGADGAALAVTIPSETILRDVYLNDSQGEELFLGTASSGLLRLNNRNDAQPSTFTPSGPYLNLFNGLKVIDGVLISGTSASPGRFASNFINTGYVIRKEGEWINRNRDTNADMLTYNANSYYVSAGTPSHYFFGSWGDAITMHVVATNETVVLNNDAGANINPSAPPNFTVVPGMDTDSNGRLWFPVYLGNPNTLYQFDPVSRQFKGFPRYQLVSVSEHYFGLMVDSFDQKWIPIVDGSQNGRGLLVQDQGNLDNISDDSGVLLTQSSNNLPNNKIQAVLQDRRGEVWVGTAEGVARFLFPDRIIKGNAADRQAERLRIRNQLTGDVTFFLNRTSITSLAMNAANEKWIGTQGDGVYHIREEGGLVSIIKHFTSNNSPLPSNNVVSVAVDDISGVVYIATDVGLLSYTDVVTSGVREMESLKVFPNPYVYDRSMGNITIEGLSDETRIHILSVDGKLMQRLDVRGGRTTWNALDQFGNRLSTGVYTVIAVNPDGSQKGVGKVAIVR